MASSASHDGADNDIRELINSAQTLRLGSDADEESSILLSGKALHKLMEPVVLVLALTESLKTKAGTVNPAPPPPLNVDSPEELFHAFVNKLCLVCDSKKGDNGDTITSIVVMKQQTTESERVHYYITSNSRTRAESEATASYVRSLLERVNTIPARPKDRRQHPELILDDVLKFNRPRISFYMREMVNNARMCIEHQGV